MGRNDEIGQLKPIQCTIPKCQQHFDTVKEMIAHKVRDPEHFYCKKCDEDFEDYATQTQHKVKAMQPWLEGRMNQSEGASPKHIVCEFCGEDFKSFGGRKLHREQRHQADQHINCPGCELVFTRGGDLIAHLEKGNCQGSKGKKGITRQQYLGNVQQKQVVKEMMKNPFELQVRLAANAASKEEAELLLTSGAQDEEEGGVALLDQDDPQQKYGVQPLPAEVDLIDMNERLALSKDNPKSWPSLSGQEPLDLGSPTGGVSLTAGSQMSASEFASQKTRRRGGKEVYTESYPSLSSANSTAADDREDTSLNATIISRPLATRTTAWTTGVSSQALFPHDKSITPPGHWDNVLAQRREEAAADNSTNLLHCRWWDPNAKEYDGERFFNHVIRKYCCPFSGCDGRDSDILSELEEHISIAHIRTHYTCPLCLKRFKMGSALISHSEAGGKCQVKRSPAYPRLLDEVSGGFLKAEHLREPKIAKGEAIEVGGGLMSTRITPENPIQW